jgi:hypothetical protein
MDAQKPQSRQKSKKKYEKPQIKSESLMTFGALCNGSLSGGRKQSTGAPNFCNSGKLLS